ncbi:alpha-L-glutamate ligase-like protein [Methylocaldum sp.]|uniref:alpha-L-glutamate ligase-like protein n=1 Tax=Methylocaldum sp. TaxID=1969727 RepID=UPI002D503380|nr:alpha-L-glutamate ligase-like protein [Methylocaldum sp.]HYE34951.1 alpha-L-glutamate ligase-like protein [Methylocaldum sp.]
MGFSRIRFPWERLRTLGIMGMNERNADFILPYNSRRNFPLVDDKSKTKALALSAGIAVPKLYGIVEIEHQIEKLGEMLGPYEDFVIKPAHGSGGEGILIIAGRQNGRHRKANGVLASEDEVGYHISNILSGMYSLGGLPDSALIEYRVKFDPMFEQISYQGVPDIRTVVFRGVPVLAMMRLPTRLSDGKANLHQGAIGVGIHLANGRTFSGVWHETPIDQHPDTGGELAGLEIPYWNEILALTARCHDLVGLGFIGVDIVLDKDFGPLMLEINARPGLSIQLANKIGFLPRLRQIERMREIPASVDERIKLAQELAA